MRFISLSNQSYFSKLGFNFDHFVFTPYATNKLIETTNQIWCKYWEHKSLLFIKFYNKNHFRPFGGPKLTICPSGKLEAISTCPTRFLVAQAIGQPSISSPVKLLVVASSHEERIMIYFKTFCFSKLARILQSNWPQNQSPLAS